MVKYIITSAKDLDLDLFLIADPSEERVLEYKQKSVAIIAQNENNDFLGFISFHNSFYTGFEINNIMVYDQYQFKGIAKELIKRAEKIVKDEGGKYFEVSTGNSSISAIALYQKVGFRIVGIERDYFLTRYNEKIIENSIECVDLIRFRKLIE